MKRTLIALVLFQCILGIVSTRTVSAAIYKYIDKDGIACYADDLQVVPEKYRSTAVILEGEEKEGAAKAVGQATGAQPGPQVRVLPVQAAEPSDPDRPFSVRLMISGAVTVCCFLAFAVLSGQKLLKENDRLRSTVRLALVCIVSVYLVTAHARDVMAIFGMAGKTIDNVQQRSAEKGRKAAQAIKQFDDLVQDAQKQTETPKDPPHDETRQ